MLFLVSMSSCSDYALLGTLTVAKKIINLIQLIGPILCIVSMAYILVKMIQNPDDKKIPNRLRNSAIALVLIFFVPLIVNAFINILGDGSEFKNCWESANQSYDNAKYHEINSDNGKTIKVYESPSKYQGGVPKSSSESTSKNKSGNSKVVFIGDSRTVQMYAYLNNNWSGANYSSGGVHEVGSDIYVAEGAQGLSWMKSTGIPAAEKYFTSNTAIVILMGVNDLYNADSYISYINSNASKWKSNSSSLYFVSVNPCNGSYSGLNSKIQTFNSKVKSGVSKNANWIDTYSYLTSNGFKTTDGLHYDSDTTSKIYNYIKSKV